MTESIDVDVKKVEPSPIKLRIDDSLDEPFVLSMKYCGQIAPIVVRPHPSKKGFFQLICGHRRFNAAKELGWDKIRCEVKNVDDERMIQLALVENLHRKELSDFEKGLIFKFIHEKFGKSYEEIGNMIGHSKQYVANHIAMASMFNGMKMDNETIRIANNLTEKHARAIIKVKDVKDRLRIAKFVVDEKLSVKETLKIVEMFGKPKQEYVEFETLPQTTHLHVNAILQTYVQVTNLCYPTKDSLNFAKMLKNSNNKILRTLDISYLYRNLTTHIDICYDKFLNKKKLPDFIIKSAVVIEVKKEKPDEITLDEVELKSSGLKRGMCILISTGWERFYGKEEYLIHPYLSINLAKWLVKHGIEVIGIDTPSIDHPFLKRKEIEKLPVHDILLENKVLIIENLKSLEKMARKNIGLCIILKRGGKRRSINAAHIMSITPKV